MSLHPCKHPACDRLVSVGTDYCCAPCRIANEPPDIYDPDGYHSEGCDQRQANRGLTPDQLRRQADLLESQSCTGVSARWCPVHGTCQCDRGGPRELLDLDDPNCPLHAPESSHAEAGLARMGL